MGKMVKVSDAVSIDFKKVEYPSNNDGDDVFIRKLDRCTVTTTFSYECDSEVQKEMAVIITKHHRRVVQDLENELVRNFSQVVKTAASDKNKNPEKIQKEAGAKIHAMVNEKHIRHAIEASIFFSVKDEAASSLKEKWNPKWEKSASLKIDIKNLQHQKDVLRFFDSNKYIRIKYDNKKGQIGKRIDYDNALFGDFFKKIEVTAKVTAKAVVDVKTDTVILTKAVDGAFDDEMDRVTKKIQEAMNDAKKLVQKAKTDKEKESAVKYTETAVKTYLGEIEKNVAKGVGDRIYELAKTMGKRRSANIQAGVTIALSIVGLAVSITLLVVPVGGIGGAVAAVSLTKTILNGVKSLVSVYNTVQKLNKDAQKQLKKLLDAIKKMADEYKKNGAKLKIESERVKTVIGLGVCWEEVVSALGDYRLAVSTLIQKVQNIEKDIQKIIKDGEKANEKIIAEFMKDIPNEEQMRKDLDKLNKILEPVLTKDKERKHIIDQAAASLNVCKEAHKIEKQMRDQIKASKAELKFTNLLGTMIMSQLPSLTKIFGAESTRMEKLEEVLKAVTAPLAAL
ncbi:MAG: hypothetical protein JEZ11_02280 [Desulfobacterales bacterium]|nr:hypothetical protein [Desulfobacterales bacterium]